jgi:hypothetical protein
MRKIRFANAVQSDAQAQQITAMEHFSAGRFSESVLFFEKALALLGGPGSDQEVEEALAFARGQAKCTDLFSKMKAK